MVCACGCECECECTWIGGRCFLLLFWFLLLVVGGDSFLQDTLVYDMCGFDTIKVRCIPFDDSGFPLCPLRHRNKVKV